MSLNPIQFGTDVLEQYGRYLLTTFRLSDPRLAEPLRAGLAYGPGSGERLARGPYVYLNRPFVEGPGLPALVAERGLGLHPALATAFRFPSLRKHQEKALRAATAGNHVLLATGTGSGKTEGFLLPIVDHCLKLRDAAAPAGLTAVLVYPMNALVNDQLERLRPLLAGTRITFGRYTGETPQAEATATRLTEPRAYTKDELARAQKLHGEMPLPWEECASRDEILERRPRILLTNYSQLEYLLLRDKDLALFRGAPLRFLVLDEVHTYTGALGSQVACLVRRLRAVAGRGPADVVCIGSSATVTDREASGVAASLRGFASRLFGVEEAKVEVVREEYQRLAQPDGERYTPPAPPAPRELLRRILDAAREPLLAEEIQDVPDSVVELAEALCGRRAPAGGDPLQRLHELLAPNRIVETLQQALARPVLLDEVLPRLQALGGRSGLAVPDLQAEALAYLVLGALARRGDEPLLRPKLHFFVQGLAGLWIRWVLRGRQSQPEILFSDRGETAEMPLPLSFCRACGQPFVHLFPGEIEAVDTQGTVSGYRPFVAAGRLPLEGAEEGAEERAVLAFDRLTRADEEPTESGQPAWLCRHCGGLHDRDAGSCLGPKCGRPGPLVPLFTWQQPIGSCPACGARSSEKSPVVTLVRSTEVNDVMVLAQTMLSSMPEADLRKLLVFADSRQDAAFQAGWMEGRSLRFRLRHMTYRVLAERSGQALYFKRLLEEIVEIATAEGLVPAKGSGREPASKRLEWLLVEELFAASERQRRNSLEQLGLATVDLEGVDAASMGSLAAGWATELGTTPEGVADTVAVLLAAFRLRHAVSHEWLARLWSDRDREVRDGIVVVADHWRPHLVVPKIVSEKRGLSIGLHSKNRQTIAERVVAAAFPGIRGEQIDAFLDAVVDWARADKLFVDRKVREFRYGKLQDLANAAGGLQLALERVQVRHADGRWLCGRCGKAWPRALPSRSCPAWRCDGTVSHVAPDSEHYDVVQYTRREFVPLLSREHSAQVPKDDRLEAEREFKRPNGRINTLVATPTLELGVDIGPLEMVLMRNVPPSPANYAQRSGRAGRRHRLGAVFSYCRNVQHDHYFYDDPPAMIAGEVRIPGFSMRNVPVVRQHLYSTVLTALRADAAAEDVLAEAFPTYVWRWFGARDEGGTDRYLPAAPRLDALRGLLGTRRQPLVATLRQTFAHAWPEPDAWVVDDTALTDALERMPADLERVVATLYAEVANYRRILEGFRKREDAGEKLAADDITRRNHYEAALRRLWAETQDNYSIAYLARRGFLPGYALVKEQVRAVAIEPPIDLSRPSVVALRELAPASLIYANRRQYRPTGLEIYRLKAQDPHFKVQSLEERMVFDPVHERVASVEATTEGGAKPDVPFTSIQLIDVELDGLGRISDQDEYRTRRAYRQHALLLAEHGGGHRGKAGLVPYELRQEGRLRVVNLGTKKRPPAGPEHGIGFPICRVCGELRSSLASATELENFGAAHKKRCGQDPDWIALHVDARSDLLMLGPFSQSAAAVNALEALRIGCRRVLEMGETELETEILVDEHGEERGVLFDPLPGGSGFLPLAMEHWVDIVDAAQEALDACDCDGACYRCLLHFRNQQHHTTLDRRVALAALGDLRAALAKEHDIPPVFVKEEDHHGKTDSNKEDKLLELLATHGFPQPEASQHRIDFPGGGYTVADFAWPSRRLVLFVDGLSTAIHGTPDKQKADRIKRTKAEALGWKVRSISAQGLSDDTMLRELLEDLALLLDPH